MYQLSWLYWRGWITVCFHNV